jgi:multiple sugar transport system permease protein
MRRSFLSFGLHAVLVIVAGLTLTPLVWMVSASLMKTGEANTFPPHLWPHAATLEHYVALFTRLDLSRYLLNSLVNACTVTMVALVVNTLAGYAFAKFRFAGRDTVFRTLVAALVIPSQVGMLPLFLLLKSMGMVNTMWGLVIPGLASIFGIFMVRQYALGLPDELVDAARMDGAGDFRIFRTIMLPLMKPILVTLAVFTFLSTWNDFMWPLIILSDETKYTLPVALAGLVGEHVQDTELMMAGSVLTVLPVMVLFLVLQRSYIQGVLAGSVKG